MTLTIYRALPLFILISLSTGSAHAALLETPSRVSDVTIYTDRALVTRAAKVHLAAGEHTISITDMPAGLNESTLRVQGKAGAAVKIGTVELKRVYLAELANVAEREKAAQIEAKNNERALLEARIKALKTKEEFINRVVESSALKHDDQGNAKLDFAPEKWQQAWTLVQTGMGETQKELANENFALSKLDAEILKLQQELAQVRSQQSKQRRDVHVNVVASAETDIDLALSYQTSGAHWRPVYDARLDTNSGQLQLEQYGSVSQRTGEDWGKVALTLSTAQPAQGSEMPAMNEWWVRLFQPAKMMKQRTANLAGDATYQSFSTGFAGAAPASAEASMEDKVIAAEQMVAQAKTTEYSAEFSVPGRVDLKSTNDSTKLFIGEAKMKADLAVQTTPRLGTQAYLFAKATNGETYPLIPGEVAKYRDGAFIGNASLPLVRPSEEAKFSFGVDDRVKVEYKRLKEKQDNPTLVVVGDVSIERQYETKVQNLHKEPISITVLDQYPVSGDPDVKATLLTDETTPGFVVADEKRQGSIAWTETYKAKEEKTYTLGFRVKYPKNTTLQGL